MTKKYSIKLAINITILIYATSFRLGILQEIQFFPMSILPTFLSPDSEVGAGVMTSSRMSAAVRISFPEQNSEAHGGSFFILHTNILLGGIDVPFRVYEI